MISVTTRRLRALPSRTKFQACATFRSRSPAGRENSKLNVFLPKKSQRDVTKGRNTTKSSDITKKSLPVKIRKPETVGPMDQANLDNTLSAAQTPAKSLIVARVGSDLDVSKRPTKIRHLKNRKREIKAVGKDFVHVSHANRNKVKPVEAQEDIQVRGHVPDQEPLDDVLKTITVSRALQAKALEGKDATPSQKFKQPSDAKSRSLADTLGAKLAATPVTRQKFSFRSTRVSSATSTTEVPTHAKHPHRFESPCATRTHKFASPCATPVTRVPFESPTQSSAVESRLRPSILPRKLFEEDTKEPSVGIKLQQIVTPLFQRVQAIDSCDNLEDFSSDEDTSDEAYECRHILQEQREIHRAMLLLNPKFRKQEKRVAHKSGEAICVQQDQYQPPNTPDIAVDQNTSRCIDDTKDTTMLSNLGFAESTPCFATSQADDFQFSKTKQDGPRLPFTSPDLFCKRIYSQSTVVEGE